MIADDVRAPAFARNIRHRLHQVAAVCRRAISSFTSNLRRFNSAIWRLSIERCARASTISRSIARWRLSSSAWFFQSGALATRPAICHATRETRVWLATGEAAGANFQEVLRSQHSPFALRPKVLVRLGSFTWVPLVANLHILRLKRHSQSSGKKRLFVMSITSPAQRPCYLKSSELVVSRETRHRRRAEGQSSQKGLIYNLSRECYQRAKWSDRYVQPQMDCGIGSGGGVRPTAHGVQCPK